MQKDLITWLKKPCTKPHSSYIYKHEILVSFKEACNSKKSGGMKPLKDGMLQRDGIKWHCGKMPWQVKGIILQHGWNIDLTWQ